MGFAKTIIRVGVVGGLAAGAVMIVAHSSPRAGALLHQVRVHVANAVDGAIDDPIALRHQLRDLEAKYPERIGQIRADLNEVRAQLAELGRDAQVSAQVVELAMTDRSALDGMLAQADTARAESPYRSINIRFNNSLLSYDEGLTRAAQLSTTVNAYRQRVEMAEQSTVFLAEQQRHLEELLGQLETERAEFQAQIWQLDNEIEAIERNDTMIEMVEKRQRTIDRYDRFESVSLDQVKDRMARIRMGQEERLRDAVGRGKTMDYETKAKAMLEREETAKRLYEKSKDVSVFPTVPTAMIITPGNSTATAPATETAGDIEIVNRIEADAVALLRRLTIEN